MKKIIGIICICLVYIQCAKKNEGAVHLAPSLRFEAQTIGIDSTIFYVPDDLKIELWAETPLFYNPTNMDVDYKGRIWITEAVNYRNFNPHSENRLFHKAGDRVMILEDKDQDGKAESSKLFVQDTDLVAPLGIAVIGNKVIVSCSPHLIVYTDSNGDDIPDQKEIVLTGFGGVDHDHSLHSVVAGPDGNWYFNTGNAGPHIVKDKAGWTLRSGSMYTGGSPYNKENKGNQKSDDGRVWVGGLSLRMNKDIKEMKVMAHNFRNSYEITIDSYGNLWQNDNDDQVMACRTSFLMEGSNAGFFSKDGSRSWMADRRPWQDLFTAHWHQSDPGVLPVGDDTGAGSPTGIVINESDQLGVKYRGVVLSAEAGRNVLYAYWPEKKGAGYTMKRHNLISTLPSDNKNYQWNNDIDDKRMWFRPSDVCIGTDGAIYIADWYDPIVGGHAMHDTVGYGRILRISAKNKNHQSPTIDIKTNEGKILAITSAAINVRNLGYEAILHDAHKESLVQEVMQSNNSYIRARGIYLLSKINPENIINYVTDKDENIQIAAFRSIKNNEEIANRFIAQSEKLIPAFLREIAISCRDWPYTKAKPVIEKLLANYPSDDRYFHTSFSIACDGKEEEVYTELIKPNLLDGKWSPIIVDQVYTIHAKASVKDIHDQLAHFDHSPAMKEKLTTAIAFVKDSTAVPIMIELSKSSDSIVSSQAFWWLQFRKTNEWDTLYDWKQFETLLSSEKRTAIEWQNVLLKSKDENEKIATGVAMAKTAEGGKILLSLATAGGIINGKLRDTISKIIVNNPDASVRAIASDLYWRKTDKKSHQYSIELISKMEPNLSTGKNLFESKCSTCHLKNKIGKDIGPDLSTIGQKLDARNLIDAVVNPSATIAFGFELSTFKTKSETFYGFPIGDDTKNITIKDMTGTIHVVDKSQLKERKPSETSLMPPAHLLNLTDREVADIVGYLRMSQ